MDLATLKELIRGNELIVAPVVLQPDHGAAGAGGRLQGDLSLRRDARLGEERHRGQPDAAGDGRRGGRHPRRPASCRWCSTPAAAGAIRCTSIAPSRSPRPRASRRSRSRTSCCRGGSSTMSASTIWCRPSSSCKKLKEALAARTDPNLVIIARTNARRAGGIEEAIRRGEAFAKAGADMVFCFTRDPEEVRMVGERVPHAADDVRAGRRLRDVEALARRLRQARLPAGGVVRHGVRRDVQGGAAVLPVPRQRHDWTRSSAPAAATP